MATFKRKNRSGKIVWMYAFRVKGIPGLVRESGFKTKGEAGDAERERRNQIDRDKELVATGSTALPKTLRDMLNEFFREHGSKSLAPKTLERYQQEVEYLSPDLLAMPLHQIKPLHFSREWNRLLESGGHDRKTKTARPLSKKTVRNISGTISSAYTRGKRWGLVAENPIKDSEPPKPCRREGAALTPQQQELVLSAAGSTWGMVMLLELDQATGVRRGELLALRWSDIGGGAAIFARSLCQTKAGLVFKSPKNGKARTVALSLEILSKLDKHRAEQRVNRDLFGPTYRADLDLVFCNPDGTALRPDSVSASISNLFRRLKIAKPKGAALHLFRHTHGSEMLASGVDLATVSARLGHSNPWVTAQVYAHALQGKDVEAVEKWQKFKKNVSSGKTKERTV